MPLQIGQQLGSYEITSLLGKGGMGEVYRARDSKLKRDVAIKALPDEFSRDHDRLIRFQREAEVLASLNHCYAAFAGFPRSAVVDMRENVARAMGRNFELDIFESPPTKAKALH